MSNISERLKEVRLENRLTQAQFGKMLAVSQDTISLWEKGKSLPSVECVLTVCKLFHVSADYLLGLTEY